MLARPKFYAAAALLVVSYIVAAVPAPRFEDYPVKEAYRGTNAPLILTRDDQSFRTRLKMASAQKPNFGGHYILTAWGCGAECLAGALIHANTGRVHWFPFTICCWTATGDGFQPIRYRVDSSLVVFSGSRNEHGENATHYYVVDRGTFVHIDSIRIKPAAGAGKVGTAHTQTPFQPGPPAIHIVAEPFQPAEGVTASGPHAEDLRGAAFSKESDSRCPCDSRSFALRPNRSPIAEGRSEH